MRGVLNDDQCDAVKVAVVEMFEECEVHSYPIDPFEIAGKLYYVICPYSSLDFAKQLDARATSDDAFSRVELNPTTGMNQYVIYYDDSVTNANRIRWTLLHEIGHCYLGHHDHLDDSLQDIEEAEANLFAKYSIAPPPLINVLKLRTPEEIARTFLTTDTAASNCYSYYQKWLQYGPKDFTGFEIRLLHLFGITA